MMQSLGKQILADIHDCDRMVINSIPLMKKILTDAASQVGATVREVMFHKFSPYGISGVVIISESHFAIHTWPDRSFLALDLFTCGDTVDPWLAFEYILREVKGRAVTVVETKRGVNF